MILETLIKNFSLPAIKDMISSVNQILIYVGTKESAVKNEAIEAIIDLLNQFKDKENINAQESTQDGKS